MCTYEWNKLMELYCLKMENIFECCMLLYFRISVNRCGEASNFIGPSDPCYLLFLCQVLLHFETEHQFEQNPITAEAIGIQKGAEAVRDPPAIPILVKTSQR